MNADPGIEKTVLASMLMVEKVCAFCIDALNEDCFLDLTNRTIFRGVLDIYRKAGVFDQSLLIEELRKQEILTDELKWAILELPEFATTPHIEYHCKILVEKAVLRGCVDTFSKGAVYCGSDKAVAEKALETAEKRIFELKRDLQGLNGPETYDHVESVRNNTAAILQSMSRKESGLLPFPVQALNRVLGYAQIGKKYLFSGFKKGGKSRFMRCCISQWLNMGYGGVIIATEGSNEEILRCILAHRCRVNTKKIENGTLSQDEYLRLKKEADILEGQPLWIAKKPGASPLFVDATLERARSYFLRRGQEIKWVLIDTVQKMRKVAESTAQMHEEIAPELEQIGDKHKIVQFWIMQYVSDAERGSRTKSGLHAHIRYGQAYTETADAIITFDDRRKSKKEIEHEQKNGYRHIRAFVVQREGESDRYIDMKAERQYSSYCDTNDGEESFFDEDEKQVANNGADNFFDGVVDQEDLKNAEIPVAADGKEMF